MKQRILASLLALTLPVCMVLPVATAFADPPSSAPIAVPAPSSPGLQSGVQAPAVKGKGLAVVSPSATAGFGTAQLTPADASVTLPKNTCGPDLQSETDAAAQAAAAQAAAAQAAAQSAAAQAAATAPASGTAPAQTDPESGGTVAASDTPAPAPAAAPVPQAKDDATMSCASDQIKVEVAARPFEYHFGDKVQIEVGIKTAPGAQIDLAPLVKQGHLYMVGNQQFELAEPPVVMSKKEADGSTVYDIMLVVRQFLPAPSVNFYMQLPYSVSKSDKNGAPIWQVLQTPDFLLIQDVAGAPGMAQMDSGNAAVAQPRASWGLAPLAVLVTLLLLIWPVVAVVRNANRLIPRKSMPRAAQAWLALRRVRLSGDEIGYSSNHYGRISNILRQYLSFEHPDVKSMTAGAIERSYQNDSVMSKLASALAKIERVIVGNGKLNADEHKQLLAEIDEIVPVPTTCDESGFVLL